MRRQSRRSKKARIRLVYSLIDALMAQPHRRVFGKAVAQVAADLLRAPPPKQELGDHGAEVLVGLDTAPMMTCSAHRGATLSVEGAIPAASHRVASELTRNRRRRPTDSHGDCPKARTGPAQIGDLDAFVLRQVARTDLANREAI